MIHDAQPTDTADRFAASLQRTPRRFASQPQAERATVPCRTCTVGLSHRQAGRTRAALSQWSRRARLVQLVSPTRLSAVQRPGQEQWLERTRARLIDCAHWHVVFTIPHELNLLWTLNTDALMRALFAAARANAAEVVFRYSPHTETDQPKRRAVLLLAPERFLARVLAHAPEPNRLSVRYYGLYAHACAEQLNGARALHQQPPVQPTQPILWQRYLARFPRALDNAHCPHCHAPLVRGALIASSRAPP